MTEDFNQELTVELDLPILPESVITSESAKLARYSPVVMDLLSGLWFGNCEFSFDNPVPVQTEDKKVLGYASLRLDDDCLVADIAMTYNCPERLDIDNGRRLYAVPVGYLELAKPQPSLVDYAIMKIEVKFVKIFAILLTETKPLFGYLDSLKPSDES